MEREDRDAADVEGAQRDADERIGELEGEAKEMEDRLGEVASEADEVEVPEPGDESLAPGVSESDVPEGEGDAAEDAGQ